MLGNQFKGTIKQDEGFYEFLKAQFQRIKKEEEKMCGFKKEAMERGQDILANIEQKDIFEMSEEEREQAYTNLIEIAHNQFEPHSDPSGPDGKSGLTVHKSKYHN